MKRVATTALVLVLGATTAFASTGHRSQRPDRQPARAAASTQNDAAPFRLAGDPGSRASLTGGPAGGIVVGN